MFPNLKAEMARFNVSIDEIAEIANVSLRTARYKLDGESEFTRAEIFKIKNNLFPKLSVEYLFATEATDDVA